MKFARRQFDTEKRVRACPAAYLQYCFCVVAASFVCGVGGGLISALVRLDLFLVSRARVLVSSHCPDVLSPTPHPRPCPLCGVAVCVYGGRVCLSVGIARVVQASVSQSCTECIPAETGATHTKGDDGGHGCSDRCLVTSCTRKLHQLCSLCLIERPLVCMARELY